MKKLNLTATERSSVMITFEVNQFIAFIGDYANDDYVLIGKYFDTSAMDADLDFQGITGKMDSKASRMYAKLA